MNLIYPCVNGDVYRQQSEPRVLPRPDVIERHEGIRKATEYIIELRGPRAKSLWVRAVSFIDENGNEFGEGAIMNNSINDPIGYVKGFLFDEDNKRQLTQSKGLHDQTSHMWTWGDWKYAPDRSKLSQLLQNHDFTKIPDEAKAAIRRKTVKSAMGYPGDWMRPYQPGGEDHYGDTNTAGSPNACYSNRTFTAHALYPNNHGPIIALLDWVKAQYGTIIHEEDRGAIVRPGRPYQLFDFHTGGYCRPYRQDMARARFSYGTIKEDFGRGDLPRVQAQDEGYTNYNAWHGKRLMWPSGYNMPYAGYVRMGNRVSAEGWNGHDAEHRFRINPLAAACLLTPSVFARDLMTCLLETSIQWEEGVEWPEVHDWNSRARSWNLLTFSLGAHVLDSERYWKIARRLRDNIIDGEMTPHPWAKEWLWAGSRHRNDDPAPLWEISWQVSPGVYAADQASWLDKADEVARWNACRQKGQRIVSKALVKDQTGHPVGLGKMIRIDERGATPVGDEVAWNGVHHWGVASCWREPWAQVGWRVLKRSHRNYDVNRGSEQAFEWHWQQVCRS